MAWKYLLGSACSSFLRGAARLEGRGLRGGNEVSRVQAAVNYFLVFGGEFLRVQVFVPLALNI